MSVLEGLEKLGASPQLDAAACCRSKAEATRPAVNAGIMVVIIDAK